MKKVLSLLLMIVLPTSIFAAEGGLSNYVPAFYGDLALAVAPPDGWSFRNDTFYFSGDIGGSLRSGLIEANADITLVYDYLSFLYKPGVKMFSPSVAFAITQAIGSMDIDADVRVGALSANFDDDHTGLGDTTLSSIFYWNYEKVHFSFRLPS